MPHPLSDLAVSVCLAIASALCTALINMHSLSERRNAQHSKWLSLLGLVLCALAAFCHVCRIWAQHVLLPRHATWWLHSSSCFPAQCGGLALMTAMRREGAVAGMQASGSCCCARLCLVFPRTWLRQLVQVMTSVPQSYVLLCYVLLLCRHWVIQRNRARSFVRRVMICYVMFGAQGLQHMACAASTFCSARWVCRMLCGCFEMPRRAFVSCTGQDTTTREWSYYAAYVLSSKRGHRWLICCCCI